MWKRDTIRCLSTVGLSEASNAGPEREGGGQIETTLWSTTDSHFPHFYYLPYSGKEKMQGHSRHRKKSHSRFAVADPVFLLNCY